MKEKQYLPLNLQFFAEGGGEGQPPDDGGGTPPVGGAEKESYTKDEVLALLQTEADKKVQQALKEQEKKYQKELSKQKSLVGLDTEARENATKEQRIAELEEELAQFRLSNAKAEVTKVLSNRGLDANLVDFVVTTDDTDECLEKIEVLDNIFKAMIKREMDTRLKAGATTPKNSIGLEGNITKEQFATMTLSERAALAKNNKALYEQLTKR